MLRGDLHKDIASAAASLDTLLDYNLPGGVARNLLGAKRELQRVQGSIAAAVTIAEMEEVN